MNKMTTKTVATTVGTTFAATALLGAAAAFGTTAQAHAPTTERAASTSPAVASGTTSYTAENVKSKKSVHRQKYKYYIGVYKVNRKLAQSLHAKANVQQKKCNSLAKKVRKSDKRGQRIVKNCTNRVYDMKRSANKAQKKALTALRQANYHKQRS